MPATAAPDHNAELTNEQMIAATRYGRANRVGPVAAMAAIRRQATPLREGDVEAIAKFAHENGITDGSKAVERYNRARVAGVVAIPPAPREPAREGGDDGPPIAEIIRYARDHHIGNPRDAVTRYYADPANRQGRPTR